MLLSSAIHKDHDLVIFGAWFGEKYSDNSKSLFEYALIANGKKCYWVTKSKKLYDYLSENGVPVVLRNSIEGIILQLLAGVAFSSTGKHDFNPMLLGSCYHVELWHGVGGGKKIGYDNESFKKSMDNWRCRLYERIEKYPYRNHYYISTSSEMTQVFKSAFRTDEKHIIMAGQPRNDMFFDSSYKIKSFESRQFADMKVITYLPTHRLEGKEKIKCSSLFDFSALNDFCISNNCIFIIKKHFYHKDEVEDVSLYSNIIDWTNKPGIDTNELLMVSDYLISDYSSVTADYLLLERPIFYYCYDLEEYLEKDRDMYWPYDKITPGPKCRTFNELLDAMKNIIEDDKDDYKEERERVLSMFYGPQARKMVSQDILDAVEKIIGEINRKKKRQ